VLLVVISSGRKCPTAQSSKETPDGAIGLRRKEVTAGNPLMLVLSTAKLDNPEDK
jgi:hypothetical protein